MRSRVLVVVMISSLAVFVAAKSSSSSQRPRSYRLVQPWSKLTTLTDEQREKIYNIHRNSLDEVKKIQAQERKEILGLLSTEQKLELVKVDEKDTVARKIKAAAAVSPTTAASDSPQTEKSAFEADEEN
ncbi:MAG TPA: hypothetical protein VF669_07080 [Tepidisphaeraceae bacterium]|jgi:Spy/CpxP family protein refolding chaperone